MVDAASSSGLDFVIDLDGIFFLDKTELLGIKIFFLSNRTSCNVIVVTSLPSRPIVSSGLTRKVFS